MSKGGEFEIKVWSGGHPIWCELFYEGQKLPRTINALELRDLAYAVEKARTEARQVARGSGGSTGMDPKRADDY